MFVEDSLTEFYIASPVSRTDRVNWFKTIIIIIIIIRRSAVQGWERVMYIISDRRPQPHNTNL